MPVRHRYGVQVRDKIYYRDEFYGADCLTRGEWVAFVGLLLVMAVWVGVVGVGLVWLVRFVIRALNG